MTRITRSCARLPGFPGDTFFDFAAPRYTYMDEAEFVAALNEQNGFDDHTGTLREGLRWYAFGSRKAAE